MIKLFNKLDVLMNKTNSNLSFYNFNDQRYHELLDNLFKQYELYIKLSPFIKNKYSFKYTDLNKVKMLLITNGYINIV